MKTLIVLILIFLPVFAGAENLKWDYTAAEWDNADGFIVTFNEDGQTDAPYTKTLGKSDVLRDGDIVTFEDIETNLNLAFGQSYTFTVSAYNLAGRGGESNSIVHQREGYEPPEDSLPPQIVIIQPGTVIITISE